MRKKRKNNWAVWMHPAQGLLIGAMVAGFSVQAAGREPAAILLASALGAAAGLMLFAWLQSRYLD